MVQQAVNISTTSDPAARSMGLAIVGRPFPIWRWCHLPIVAVNGSRALAKVPFNHDNNIQKRVGLLAVTNQLTVYVTIQVCIIK